MNGLRKRFLAGVLTTAISITSAGTAFAAGETKKGFWASVGEWVVDRGTDIGSATTKAASATGQWFVNRGEDICEVSAIVGKWTSDRASDFVVLVTDTGDAIVCAASNFDPSVLATKEYYLESGEKLIFGEYSDKNPTALSMGLNLAASVANLDVGMDVRDLVYDVQHYGGGNVRLSSLAIDAVALLPVIGVVKNIKHVDAVVDGFKIAGKATETLADVTDTVHDAVKTADVIDMISDTTKAADTVDDVVDTAKTADVVVDTAKTVDLADDAADTVKAISRMSFKELPEEVQKTYKIYADYAWDGEKALECMSDGTDAGRVFYNLDEDLPVFDNMEKELTYTEYDAYPFGSDPKFPKSRGLCRLVRDNLGNVYFTDDHYKTFSLISEAIVG